MRLRRFAICLALAVVTAQVARGGAPGATFGQPPAPATPNPKLQVLQELGDAYAKDLGLEFNRVDVTLVATVAADSVLGKRLEEALAVGYSPAPGTFQLVPFATVKHIVKVKMGGGRTPEETVKLVLSPGNVVVQATWYFAGAAPARSYAVFSPPGAPVFDTMMSMPALRGPVFSVGH